MDWCHVDAVFRTASTETWMAHRFYTMWCCLVQSINFTEDSQIATNQSAHCQTHAILFDTQTEYRDVHLQMCTRLSSHTVEHPQ